MSRKKSSNSRSFSPKPFFALTEGQKSFERGYHNNHIVAIGSPGTGKSHVALHLACQSVFEENSHKKIVIYRSTVATRDIGFLPGSVDEKIDPYAAPYIDIMTTIFNRGDAYEMCIKKNQLKFVPTSFSRGITLNDSIVIVDEIQNMTFHELDTIFTRCGENTKFVFCGDFYQSDLGNSSGCEKFVDIIEQIASVHVVEFSIDDIVRNGVIKEYLTLKRKNS